MKNIVLYEIAIIAGLMMIFTEIAGQKPSDDQLSSAPMSDHPETVIDTSVTYGSQIGIVHTDYPSFLPTEGFSNKEPQGKENKRSIIRVDSLLQKQVSKKERPEKKTGHYPLIIKYINPIKFFLHITALK